VTSEVDRLAIVKESPELAPKIRVLPNTVDVQRIPAMPDPPGSRDVLFVGDFNYVPNQEAAEFVSRSLAPSIPSARFLLVGSSPPPDPRRPSNVTVTGRIPDLHRVLQTAAVCIAPLFHGSGTRVKILTYLAAARPVVATSKACEGLPVLDGVHLIIRDDPTEFQDAVENLLGDPEARRQLGMGGRELVESELDWRVHVPLLKEISAEVCSESRATAWPDDLRTRSEPSPIH
jgi:glycosyltransferase involved in cell wall biosynthesis